MKTLTLRGATLLLISTCLTAALASAAPALAEKMPYQTMTYTAEGQGTTLPGLPHLFQFSVFHPDPAAVVTAAELVFTNPDTNRFVKSVPITGIERYVIETSWEWDGPGNDFTWAACSLKPGFYEWHVVVTVNGVRNHHYEEGELLVEAPVAIDKDATFTRFPAVTVSYVPAPSERYFQVCDSESTWPSDWQQIPDGDRSFTWTLPSSSDGKKTVSMRFAESPGGAVRTASDSIILDSLGPRCWGYTQTVGHDSPVQLRFKITDDLSPRFTAVVSILKQDKKTLIIRTVRRQTLYSVPTGLNHWNWRCDLPRGEYHVVIEAVDLAGNPQEWKGWGGLTVR